MKLETSRIQLLVADNVLLHCFLCICHVHTLEDLAFIELKLDTNYNSVKQNKNPSLNVIAIIITQTLQILKWGGGRGLTPKKNSTSDFVVMHQSLRHHLILQMSRNCVHH